MEAPIIVDAPSIWTTADVAALCDEAKLGALALNAGGAGGPVRAVGDEVQGTESLAPAAVAVVAVRGHCAALE